MRKPAFDPYAVLGVAPDASPLQVARAHRRLAKRFHPDRGPDGDADRMRRINEAWQILSASMRRPTFDHGNPQAARPAAGHWEASRHTIWSVSPSSSHSWASWRMSAAETLRTPRPMPAGGEAWATVYRRPISPASGPRTFRDSPWAAIVAAALMVILLVAAVALNRLG
jgi:hypothetical protein